MRVPIDRANMLVGGSAKAHCFRKSSDFSFLPSDLDGKGLFTAGEPDFFVELDPAGSSHLHLFKFHVNFTTPSLSTFTGPTAIAWLKSGVSRATKTGLVNRAALIRAGHRLPRRDGQE